MPGPDYPWATFITGATWADRPKPRTITAVVLHARVVDTPDAIVALRDQRKLAYHYIALRNGAVLQLVPERGWCHHCGRVLPRSLRDQQTIAICLDGHPHQPSWPDEQVLAVSRILSVTFSQHRALPVRSAASIAVPWGRIPQLDAWPWLEMHAKVLRLETPIDRIYAAMLDDPDQPFPDNGDAYAPYLHIESEA